MIFLIFEMFLLSIFFKQLGIRVSETHMYMYGQDSI